MISRFPQNMADSKAQTWVFVIFFFNKFEKICFGHYNSGNIAKSNFSTAKAVRLRSRRLLASYQNSNNTDINFRFEKSEILPNIKIPSKPIFFSKKIGLISKRQGQPNKKNSQNFRQINFREKNSFFKPQVSNEPYFAKIVLKLTIF